MRGVPVLPLADGLWLAATVAERDREKERTLFTDEDAASGRARRPSSASIRRHHLDDDAFFSFAVVVR